jgi:hypothetical protein
MADPALGLTFTDLRIRVAEYLGIAYLGAAGDAAAQIPVDAHDLDLVGRIVNDGYRRFLGENPKWNFLNVPFAITFVTAYTGAATSTGTTTTLTDTSRTEANAFFIGYTIRITHAADGTVETGLISGYNSTTKTFTFAAITTAPASADTYEVAGPTAVEGQNYRYFLPSDFYGIVLTPFTYDTQGPRISIEVVSEVELRELRSGANSSGTVSVVAFRPVPATETTTTARWEALFWPAPAGHERVTAIYKRFPGGFNLAGAGTQRSVAGFQHDAAVMAACIAAAELERTDQTGPREAAYQQLLANSKALDARAAPARSISFGDRSDDAGGFGRRPLNYYSVGTYNGTTIS